MLVVAEAVEEDEDINIVSTSSEPSGLVSGCMCAARSSREEAVK